MNTLTNLMKYCTSKLLETVFTDLSINNADSLSAIDISHYIKHKDLKEIMKVLYVYEKIGGNLYYKQNTVPFSVIIRDIRLIELTEITQYWVNSCANGMMPIYDLGEICIPDIMPKYVATEMVNGWGIEKLLNGNYVVMDLELYPTKEIAEQRAEELNADTK